MSLINKPLVGILFNGATLALASAAWKNKVRAIYGFNGAGTGYTVFKPTNAFNSLTQLVADSSYILDVATPGFELPGAVLTGAGPGLKVTQLSSGIEDNTTTFFVRCALSSSQASDTTANVLLAFPDRNSTTCQASVWVKGVPLGQVVELPVDALLNTPYGLNMEDTLELLAVAPSGALGYHEFAFGNSLP
jgi:hypothetical protein